MERNWRVASSEKSLMRGFLYSSFVALITGITLRASIPNFALLPSVLGGAAVGVAMLSVGLIKVETGFQFAKQLLANRTGEVITEGWVWIFKPFYSGESIDARDRHIDIGEKEYVSKDNVPVKTDASCVVGFNNVAQAQSYEGDLAELVKKALEGAVRTYILHQPAVAKVIFRGGVSDFSEDEVAEIRNAVTNFKADMETTGRERVAEKVNSTVTKYGAFCREVLIENIRLPQSIEDAGGESLRETLESAGDKVDWENTLAMADSLRKAAFTDGSWKRLPPQVKGKFWLEYLAAVQAKKGQVQRISFTGGSNSLTEAAAIVGDKK